MKEPTYKQALSHGYSIMKNHKLLWIFGFFSVFLGQMGLLDIFVKMIVSGERSVAYPLFFDVGNTLSFFLKSLTALDFSASQWFWLAWLAILFVSSLVLLVFISISSQGALVDGIAQSVTTRKKKAIDVSRAWGVGVSHFWKMLIIHACKKGLLLVLGTILGFSFYSILTTTSGSLEFLHIILFILTAFVGSVISMLAIYSVGYVVVEEYSVVDALHASWDLLKEHWLVSLEVAAIVLLLNIFCLFIGAAVTVLFFAQMTIMFGALTVLGAGSMWALMSAFGIILFSLVLVWLGTILNVFVTSVWTYLFMEMHKKGIKSRILHFVRKRR